MKVLVTGGLGFIGSEIVDQLLDAGHQVRVLDGITAAAHSSPPDYLRDEVEYFTTDLSDRISVTRAVAGVDAVCHQAARVGLGVNFGDVYDYVEDNSLGTAALLRALHARNFSGRFVLASSMVVYGEGGYVCVEHGSVRPPARKAPDLEQGRFEPPCPVCTAPLAPVDLDEDAPLDPRNVYAATKVNQEHLCQAFSIVTGAEVIRLRYHNVYGPRMPRDTPYAGVASIMRSAYAAGRGPSVFEDGGQRRDFVHVGDVARANVLSLTAAEGVAGAYNIASGVPHTIGDLAEALRSAYGAEAPSPTVTGEYRLGDVRHITASPQRARDVLGFTAAVTFEAGMRSFATDPLRDPQSIRPELVGTEALLAEARRGLCRVTPAEAWARLTTPDQGSPVLVDTRPEYQRTASGVIPAAELVDSNVLLWRLDPEGECRLPWAEQRSPVIVFCQHGYSSSVAAANLRKIGVDATDVIGGFEAWAASGLPITRT